MKAYCLLRTQPFYRHDSFVTGLRAYGFEVVCGQPTSVGPSDIMLIWNRYGENEVLADKFEAAGGTVIVAENGYLNPGGGTPKFDVYEGVQSNDHYAVAIGGHNGSGYWPNGGEERFQSLGVHLHPWQDEGHILVCPGRDFGSRKLQPPSNWAREVVPLLKREFPKSEIRVRHHPGNGRPGRELHEDLKDCKLCVIWASSSGVHALVAGTRVRCLSPYWVCKTNDWWDNETRASALSRMAWAQWSVDEIADGLPFSYLLYGLNRLEPKYASHLLHST